MAVQNYFQNKRTNKPLFTQGDYLLVLQGLSQLADLEFDIVMMRFWECMSVGEIANLKQVPKPCIEKKLEKALAYIKRYCKTSPYFSRNPILKHAA